MAGNIAKRIEILEQRANSRGARWIVLEVDGNKEADEAAIEALLAPLFVRRHDRVIAVKKFVAVKGLPCIASITPL